MNTPLVRPADDDPYGDPIVTDTDRLNWIAAQGCLEIALCQTGHKQKYFNVSQGDRSLATGYTLREAIDAAMAPPSRADD